MAKKDYPEDRYIVLKEEKTEILETPEEEEMFAQRRERLYRLVGSLVRAYAVLAPRMKDAKVCESDQSLYESKVKFYLELRKDIGQASGDFLEVLLRNLRDVVYRLHDTHPESYEPCLPRTWTVDSVMVSA